ncbi:hypothetical protein QFC22_006587 [Naganishia vaughanmartiniae]|uniref:Uncharacterized protein n=1 Tax=Naganishia vaughanmartiniae TaxID=1424756 RepID=A0ACC2WKX8_9TREE|nr:hypothetical protein QFC22_006587 [Naganishia vaughanmartiniae]
MSSQKSVFFLGGTGYIGSAVLSKLLQHTNPSQITVLTRSQEKLEKIDQLDSRVKGVKGDLQDLTLLEDLASQHDIVFNTADADAAILRGMAKRKEVTGVPPLLIHTSGTGVLSDEAVGAYKSNKIYSDRARDPTANPPLLYVDDVADTALHRDVDLEIIRADERGDLKSYIIFPSTIYGLNRSVVVQQGVGNDQSLQMPALMKASIARKRPGTVGKGLNVWPNVHIDDVANLFELVYNLALNGDNGNHGRQGYFFAETGEHSLLSAAQKYGEVMLTLGLTDDSEPTIFSEEELKEYFGGSSYLGSNSRARAQKSRDLGWKPSHNPEDFYASFDEEIQRILEKAGSDLKGLRHTNI